MRQLDNLDSYGVQLFFCRHLGFGLGLKCLFKLNPWQAVVDFYPSRIFFGFMRQLRHVQDIWNEALKRVVKAEYESELSFLETYLSVALTFIEALGSG
jgi:hypothetical protein